MPKDKWKIFKNLIKDTLDQGVIEETDQSEYEKSSLLVPNKGGSYRIVRNYVNARDMILPDNHTKPSLEDCLTRF